MIELAARTAVAAAVVDPEIPVITIGDLGVLRGVSLRDDGTVRVTITPTYSGCPAVDAIADDVEQSLLAAGFPASWSVPVLAPAWSTDDITPAGAAALAGVRHRAAAPTTGGGPVAVELGVRCPRCWVGRDDEISRFAATACKALWRCRACREPFELFKTL